MLHAIPTTALALAAALLASCTSTQGSNRAEEPWLVPSANLKTQIEDQAARLPWTHGIERIELIHWFAGVGEPAYPTLLEMAVDPRRDVAGAAFAALGATRDSRLVPHLRELPAPEGEAASDLALERARTLLRLGDWSQIPVLVDGLEQERLMTRALCSQALFEATRERMGYDPRAEEPERTEAVARWRAWWASRQTDSLRPDGDRG